MRPFKVLGVQQIAIGAADKSAMQKLWVDLLGLKKISEYKSAAENVDEDILQMGEGAAACEVDLMQPLDLSKKPAVHQPPLNHIGLWVDDIGAAYDWLQAQGLRFAPGGIRKGASGHDVCFIHPKGNEQFPFSGEGVLIELVQAPAELRR
jgi:lactoylglutathione lyase